MKNALWRVGLCDLSGRIAPPPSQKQGRCGKAKSRDYPGKTKAPGKVKS